MLPLRGRSPHAPLTFFVDSCPYRAGITDNRQKLGAAPRTADEVIEQRVILLQRTSVANGTKRHFAAAQRTVAFGGKADIATEVRNDAFDPKRTWQTPSLLQCTLLVGRCATVALEGEEGQ